MSNKSKNSSDWDDEDNWEDWGDALDEISTSKSSTSEENTKNPATTTTTQNTESKKNNFNEKTSAIAVENDTNSSSINESVHKIENTSTWGSTWSWGGGTLSSVFSTATEGLGNLTNTVSKGLDQVIGVPDPAEMAQINAANEATRKQERLAASESIISNKKEEDLKQQSTSSSATTTPTTVPVLGFVTTLGSKVLNTGLDTLEGIGKKTMTILQENDPLLKNKRKKLGLENERPNLSEVLKEAKKDADQLENTLKELQMEKSREQLNFEHIFEHKCGLVHLEALEILSKESAIKIKALKDSVSGNALSELQETITEVKELMEMEDLEADSEGYYEASELNEKLTAAMEDVDLQVQFDDIVSNWQQTLEWISTTASTVTIDEIFAKGIVTLAETGALEMCKLHKIAELLLVKEHHSTATEVDCVVQLCKEFYTHLIGLTNRFATLLSAENSEEAKTLMNNLFGEMLIATKQIEKAFKLFVPIVQIGAV